MDADWTTVRCPCRDFNSTLWAIEWGHNRARAAAREQRTQDRLAVAYVEVPQIAESVGHWAQSIIPMYDTGQPEPPLPPLTDQTRARALVLAFGSTEVLAALEAWSRVVNRIHTTASIIGDGRASDSDRSIAERRQLAIELRPAARTLRDELARAIAAELRQD